jgi:heme/copper-type cytochrome/quinol oxidase subunit 2
LEDKEKDIEVLESMPSEGNEEEVKRQVDLGPTEQGLNDIMLKLTLAFVAILFMMIVTIYVSVIYFMFAWQHTPLPFSHFQLVEVISLAQQVVLSLLFLYYFQKVKDFYQKPEPVNPHESIAGKEETDGTLTQSKLSLLPVLLPGVSESKKSLGVGRMTVDVSMRNSVITGDDDDEHIADVYNSKTIEVEDSNDKERKTKSRATMMNFRDENYAGRQDGIFQSIIIDEDFDARELAVMTEKQKKDLSDSSVFEDMFSVR